MKTTALGSGNKRGSSVGALTMVIIVDAEISILQLMQCLESIGAPVCIRARVRARSVCTYTHVTTERRVADCGDASQPETIIKVRFSL